MLRFVGEGFVFPDFFTGEARIHPTSSHLTRYSSAICLLWVKREGKKRKVPDTHARACALSPAPLHGRVVNPGAPPDVGQ